MDSRQLKEGIILSTLCAVFFFLWGVLLIINPAMAGDKTVCPSGCDYTSIQMAINAASSEGGGTVYVGTSGRSTAETYNENVGMMSGVNVVSEGDNATTPYTGSGHTTSALKRATLTIIDGGGSDSVVRIPGNLSTDVTLDGFIIQNAGVADMFLIRIGGGSPTIKNNIIRNNTDFGGIGLQGFGVTISATIDNNLIHTVNGPGIGNGPNSNAIIENNEIWDCNGDEGVGIGLLGNTYPTIENNIIFNNSKAGIGSDYSHGGNSGLTAGDDTTLTIPTIRGNIISNNYAAIRLERASGDTGTINVTIDDNHCTDSNMAGIRLDGLTSATIKNNIIKNNFAGIWLNGLSNATIHNNQIQDQNMAGIRLENIDYVAISDNNIMTSGQAGIAFDPHYVGAVVQATVDGNEIQHNGQAGIYNRRATTLTVQNGNLIHHNTQGGIFILCPGSTNTIQDNTIYTNSRAGIGVNATASVTITHNDIDNNTWAGISINDAVSNSIINGDNTIHGNHQGGIRIKAANSVTVEDNSIYSNGYGGIYDMGAAVLSVNGTDIHHNQYGGIEINHDGGTGTITHNTIHDNVYGGIRIKAPCTFEISDNEIYGNLRGGIHTGDQTVNGGGFSGVPGSAVLTIKRNKVYDNGLIGYGGGIDVRHASGTIYNNLVYENHRAGIRFGDNITEIINNTVVKNGQDNTGAGIVYDDLAGAVNDSPSGYAPDDIPIKNNICTNNEKAGINVKIGTSYACPENRDYNLLCRNHGINTDTCSTPPFFCILMQLMACRENLDEIFANPLFVDAAHDNYHLQGTSPAKNAGDDLTDMGAYGGSYPITW